MLIAPTLRRLAAVFAKQRRLCGRLLLVLAGPVLAQNDQVVINEVYHSAPGNQRSEFVELFNPGTTVADLSHWSFTKGITYAFPAGTTLAPGAYLVVALDPVVFAADFGFTPLGPFDGKLSGDGEEIRLVNSLGGTVDSVDYGVEFPWPVNASGDGPSIELIHPSLDNNLGGSWRAAVSPAPLPALTYVSAAATEWIWRRGTSEASTPTTAWRLLNFSPDATWSNATLPIGFGVIDNGLTLNTTVAGMQNSFSSLFLRKQFTIGSGEVPDLLKLRYTIDDGVIIWINGVEVVRYNVGAGNLAYNALATTFNTEGIWYETILNNASAFLRAGENLIAVQVFNNALNSSDLAFDLDLSRPPATASSSRRPTPGRVNSVYSTVAPPQVRQVAHTPKQPTSADPIVITAKATDPDAMGGMLLRYQLVAPGAFIPARFPRSRDEILANPAGERPLNPAFEAEANWASVTMLDDGQGADALAGDFIYTATIPAQPHRTLVRYRLVATDALGASVRLPLPDDPSLNFACFVYNGVPDYVASSASVAPTGPGTVWPSALLTSVPVYHWLIRPADMAALQAYETSQQFTNNGTDAELAARRVEEWEGAFVADGVVYDHVRARLRGGNSRYGDFDNLFPRGKRHYKFKFNDGRLFQARDENGQAYPGKWKTLATNRMFGTKGGNGWGLPEEIGGILWRKLGVPAAETHWFHFRVIDAAAEAATQYSGDFWGIMQAVEEYDGTFLEARGMTKGNLYKMSDWIWDADRQRRYQSPDMVADGSEFNNIRDNLHGGQTAEWLRRHVNYDKWYRYSAVAEAIRHYDLFPYTDDIRHALKNLAWYFEPVGDDPSRGLCWFLPYDWDASFGPSFNNGWDHANNALYGWDSSTQNGMAYVNKPTMKIEHRNVLREFRDLVWQPDQINGLIDDRGNVIAELYKADMDRWRNAPVSQGTEYANTITMPAKKADMKAFAFTGWSGSSGPAVGAGGRGAYLDTLADGPDAGLLPNRPTIAYAGLAGHPVNGISFSCSAFSDPQGAGTFAAMQWRVGEIEDPSAPAYDPARDFIMEIDPVWESGTLQTYGANVSLPTIALRTGRTYRARVRMQDNTGRWSHWSLPYQFTTTAPDTLTLLQQNLLITEIMYNPAGPAPVGGSEQDYEYIELRNFSADTTLDLTDVRFTKGVDFDFSAGTITSLAPGAFVLVVKNRAAFEARYGTALPVAGAWNATDNLSNGGEQLKLSFGAGLAIHDFVYDDVAPWPLAPDGTGPSLVLRDPSSRPAPGDGANWTASQSPQGSPGSAELTGFALWMLERGLSNPHAPSPATGLDQLQYYAFGGDLAAPGARLTPQVSTLTLPDGGRHLLLTYRRRIDLSEVVVYPEVSDDLQTWTADALEVTELGDPAANADGTETVTVVVLDALGGQPRRFVRLRVTIAP